MTEQLLFDLEIKRTTCKIRKKNLQAKFQDLEKYFGLEQGTMVDMDSNINQND